MSFPKLPKKVDVRFEIALRNKEDAKIAYVWRQDPATKALSLRQNINTFDDFWNIYSSEYFFIKELPPLFLVVDMERVGFVCFTPYNLEISNNRQACEISLMVSPQRRGEGIGSRALTEVQQFVRQQGYDDIFALIKPENTSSRRAFAKAGFSYRITIKRQYFENSIPHEAECELYHVHVCPEKNSSNRVFIIAEIGSNWRLGSLKNDIQLAKTLIAKAKEANADAVKFQLFRPETLYAKGAGSPPYLQKMNITSDVESLFADTIMPYEIIGELAQAAKEEGIEFMSSCFSKADFLQLDPYVLRHKIASYEIGHIRLLELAARSKKPVLLSTGASTLDEIAWAIEMYTSFGGSTLTLLQCTAAYPAPSNALHLNAIPAMQALFHVDVGFSDHSRDPLCAPLAAVALGAKVIEKHITLDRNLPGPDHSFAITPDELKTMVHAIRTVEEMVGSKNKTIDPVEKELYVFAKRRVHAIASIKKGELFEEDKNVALLRPGNQKPGCHPRVFDRLLGKKATRNIAVGEGIQDGDWQ